MLTVFQIMVGVAWLIWFMSGTAGLKSGLMAGALLAAGLGAKNLLDTFWKKEQAEGKKARGAEFKELSPLSSRS